MINANNEQNEMKYTMLRLKEETSERFHRYIGKRTHDEGKRITADEAINELLDRAGVE